MTDKAEALEEIITLLAVPPISNLHRQAASMLTAQAAKMEHMRVEIEMLRDHINTETKDYVRLRNTAAKSVHRKIALRQLNKAHEVACLTMELMARRLNQAQDRLNKEQQPRLMTPFAALRGDTP